MEKYYLSEFGLLIKELRNERKCSQQNLAELAGIERNYIYYLEKGLSDPSLGVLLGIAKGLGISFVEFAQLIEDRVTKLS